MSHICGATCSASERICDHYSGAESFGLPSHQGVVKIRSRAAGMSMEKDHLPVNRSLVSVPFVVLSGLLVRE